MLALLASASFGTSGSMAAAGTSKPSASEVYSDGKRKWTPADSVKIRYFHGKDYAFLGVHGGTGEADFFPSPDGKYFIVHAQRGDAACQCNLGTIDVYAVDTVVGAIASGRHAPKPMRTIIRRGLLPSNGDYPGGEGRAVESGIDWTADSRAFRFKAADDHGIYQFYHFGIHDGKLAQLTQVKDANVELGKYVAANGSVIYEEITNLKIKPSLTYPLALSRQRLRQLLVADGMDTWRNAKFRASGLGNGVWTLASERAWQLLELSPDGRFAIIERLVPKAPERWRQYSGSGAILDATAGVTSKPLFPQLVLVDLKTRKEEPLFDAPSGPAVKSPLFRWAFFSADSRKLLIGNTALPLEGASAEERASTAYVISFDVGTKSYEILEPFANPATGLTVEGGKMLEKGRRVWVGHKSKDGASAEEAVYAYEQGQWRRRPAEPSELASRMREVHAAKPVLAQGLKLELRQDANTPPVVIASHNGRELALTGPDPALANLWITPTEPFTWTNSEGKKQTGGLLMPRERRADGKPIPLVIQLEGYLPNEFKPDGANVLAVASQALAAQGIAVLNVNIPEGGNYEAGVRSPPLIVDMIDRVVTSLAESRGIDPRRVGVVGFSYMGFLTRYAMTHPGKIKPAAAIVADSATQDYQLYIEQCVTAIFECTGNAPHGGRLFFEDKQSWLDTDVNFNADRISGPILFVPNSEGAVTQLVSIAGAFTAARRPHEIIALEPGSQRHVLTHPSTRESSLGATVDWFRFWFFGDEIVQPRDPGRQARWARIRADWEAQQAWEARGYPVGSVPNDRNTINASAYRALYEEKDVAKAIRFLEDNVRLNPRAGFAHDSLGEGYVMAGDIARALEAYDKAEQLAPKQNPNATRIPQALRADPASLAKVQQSLRNAYAAYKAYLRGPVSKSAASATAPAAR